MKNNNYIVIQGWMINGLGLTSLKDVTLFAIIYGFSQDGNSEFKGSINYLSELMLCSRNTVIRALDSLVQKELIIKKIESVYNVTFCRYSINELVVPKWVTPSANLGGGGSAKMGWGSAKMGYNNTSYNTNINNTRDKYKEERDIFVEEWNRIASLKGLVKPQKIEGARKSAINARLKEYGLEKCIEVINIVEHSDFLNGNKTDFKATIDWVTGPKNFLKIIEGNYENRDNGWTKRITELSDEPNTTETSAGSIGFGREDGPILE